MRIARLTLAFLAFLTFVCIFELQGAKLFTPIGNLRGPHGKSGVRLEPAQSLLVPVNGHDPFVGRFEPEWSHEEWKPAFLQGGHATQSLVSHNQEGQPLTIAALAVSGGLSATAFAAYLKMKKAAPNEATGTTKRGKAFKKKQKSEIPMGEVVVPMVKNRDPASDAVRAYLLNIAQYPLLAREEESELAQAIEEREIAKERLESEDLDEETQAVLQKVIERGDEAQRTFYMCNLRLVVWAAKKFQVPQNLSFMDLVQNGNLGLIKAIERWDWRKGIRFSSYGIWWIRQSISRSLGEGQTIRHPEHIRLAIRKLHNVTRDFVAEHGRPPRQEELETKLGMSADQVLNLMRAKAPTVSLDVPLKKAESNSKTLLDTVDTTNAMQPDDYVSHTQLCEQVADMVGMLQPREAYVITCRFGLDGKGTRSLQVIGENLGVTRERVRQIQNSALNRLRLCHNHVLQDHMDQYLEVEHVIDSLEGQMQKRHH
jgi:RNA polymerase primary sigma factor